MAHTKTQPHPTTGNLTHCSRNKHGKLFFEGRTCPACSRIEDLEGSYNRSIESVHETEKEVEQLVARLDGVRDLVAQPY